MRRWLKLSEQEINCTQSHETLIRASQRGKAYNILQNAALVKPGITQASKRNSTASDCCEIDRGTMEADK